MKKLYLPVLLLAMFIMTTSLFEATGQNKTYFGVNIGHAIAVETVSKILSDETDYLPVHLNLNHELGNNIGLSGLLMYRLDKDGENFLTHELGIAFGPSYLFNDLEGLSIDFKIGFARAFGKDYMSDDYSRNDFIIQPEIAYYIRFPSKLALSFGLGLQTLVKISEKPDRAFMWDWNKTGKLSHYYLPVLNISIGFIN